MDKREHRIRFHEKKDCISCTKIATMIAPPTFFISTPVAFNVGFFIIFMLLPPHRKSRKRDLEAREERERVCNDLAGSVHTFLSRHVRLIDDLSATCRET